MSKVQEENSKKQLHIHPAKCWSYLLQESAVVNTANEMALLILIWKER